MPVESVRKRRRAETVAEIKAAALDQLAAEGPGGLSLRGVARAVGMTVQSLYHYFASRDALLSALVADAHHALADAVVAAVAATAGSSRADRRVAASAAYRSWALAHRAAFLLIYGTPVPGFAPLPQDRTGEAALRLAAPFREVVFAGWSAAELAAIPMPPGAERIPLHAPGIPLPPGALVYFTERRARMHGLVMLELLGHLDDDAERSEVLFRACMRRMSDETDALQSSLLAR